MRADGRDRFGGDARDLCHGRNHRAAGRLSGLHGTLCALVGDAVSRGFPARAFDLAIVTGAGEEASRQRALLRPMVAWSPSVFLLLAILFGWSWLGASALVIIVGGLAVAVITPDRGVQDRIARTWLVPR